MAFFGLLAVMGPLQAHADRMHTVRRGDTWSKLAKRYHVKIWDLAAANQTTPKRGLRAGEELMVPAKGVTYVRPGQTLSRIARAHDCSVAELTRLNRLKGRSLRVGHRLILPGYEPEAGNKPRDYGAPEHPGMVTLVMKEEQATFRLMDEGGRVTQDGLTQLSAWLHRDPSSAPERLPHPRLAVLLANISDHFGGRPLQLFSGFRRAGGRTRGTSRHVKGRAADILVTGVSKRTLFEYCRSLGNTGCGYYPRSLFVHVDAREAPAQWVDWSRPGRRARYGTLRRPYRWKERKNPNRPREGRHVTHPDAVPLAVDVVDGQGAVRRVVDIAPASDQGDGKQVNSGTASRNGGSSS